MVEQPPENVIANEEDMQTFIEYLIHVKEQIDKYPWLKKIAKKTL